ncbi:MAG: phosphotransferase [Pseudomonadales bacterium]
MNTPQMDCTSSTRFELPAPLTFRHVFQSCPYWVGVGGGFVPQVIKPLRQNQRKHSYLLSLNDRQVVLSATARQAPFFDLHRHSINPIIEHAGQAGIGPGLIYSSFDKGFVVTEYLEGRGWTAIDFQQTNNIERLAELLKQLHSLPKDEAPVFSASKTEQCFWAEIRRECTVIPKRLQALQLRMQKVIGHLQAAHRQGVVCHNNLQASHVLETEQGLRLVGWESAAINDPYYDLVVVANDHQLSEEQLDHLLFCYAGETSFDERENFYYNMAIYIYLQTLSCAMVVDKDRQPVQKMMIEANIDTLLALLHRLGA